MAEFSKVDTFARLNPQTNLLEIIDIRTGKVLAVQKSYEDILVERAKEYFVEGTLANGESVLIERGIDSSVVAKARVVHFSQVVVDLICEKLAGGMTLTRICQLSGFPTYSILCQWRRMHPHINRQLEDAYRDRAEYLKEKVLEEAHEAQEATINEARVKIDALKWLAGVDNSKYSPRAKIEATINTPTQVVVHTGIVREPRTVEDIDDGTNQAKIDTNRTEERGDSGDEGSV